MGTIVLPAVRVGPSASRSYISLSQHHQWHNTTMKAATRPAPPNLSPSYTSFVRSGKVAKPRDTTEDCEVSLYLEKLQYLIPSNKPQQPMNLSRLELIERVIEYISQLEDVLELSHQNDMDMLECKTSGITLVAWRILITNVIYLQQCTYILSCCDAPVSQGRRPSNLIFNALRRGGGLHEIYISACYTVITRGFTLLESE